MMINFIVINTEEDEEMLLIIIMVSANISRDEELDKVYIVDNLF